MNKREIAHKIVNEFTDEQLQAFLTLFSDWTYDILEDETEVSDWTDDIPEDEIKVSDCTDDTSEDKSGHSAFIDEILKSDPADTVYPDLKFKNKSVQEFWDSCKREAEEHPERIRAFKREIARLSETET